MSFKKFILKSIVRKKSKFVYQLIGITIPIFVILFFAISMQTTQDLGRNSLPIYDIDIVGVPGINQESLPINEDLVDKIKKDKCVDKVAGIINGYININGVNCKVIGVNSSDADFLRIKLATGRKFNNDKKEIILSNETAEMLNKTVGDYVSLSNGEYNVVGVTIKTGKSGYFNESYISLKNIQGLNIFTRENVSMPYQGHVETIHINIKTNENNSKIVEDLKNQYNNESIIVMGDTPENVEMRKNVEIENKIIFILVPTIIGILLTLMIMMKSVGDRTGEISVLKAIGWKSRRIFMMILSETFILSILSFIFASIIAILVTFYTWLYNPIYIITFYTFIQTLSFSTFLQTFLIVLAMALLGSLLPAIKASRLSPDESVRK
ncbi:MAG: ABC transporter permease [Methanobrevibacter sp.]|nr:ABC transporter permease [Candidatus Methanovirga procula]